MIPPSKQAAVETKSLENPQTKVTCDALLSPGGGGTGPMDPHITPITSWNYSAVYAAIRLLSETVAQLPLNLYRRDGEDTEIAHDNPLQTLLHDAPNPLMTSFVWRETQMAHILSYGNGYAYISRDVTGKPEELQLLSAAATYPYTNPDGTIYYQTTLNARHFKIQPENMLHIPAIGFDGLVGKSPITMHRETIGLSQSATAFGKQLFSEGTNIGSVISTEKSLGPAAQQNITQGFEKWRGKGYTGAILLDEGMSYHRTMINPDDAQFLETRKFQLSEIARIFNIPNHLLRDLEKSSFNNISEQSIDFLRYTMSPWLMRWEQELNRKLLTVEQRQTLYFKFQTGGLLRGTQTERYEAYASGINNGWMTRNEVRGYEELNPIPGLDDILIPLNMESQADRDAAPDVEEPTEAEAPAVEEEPAPVAEDRSRYEAITRNAAASFARYLDGAAKKADFGKLAEMQSRHISPVLEAAGASDIRGWEQWMASIDLDGEMPDAEEVYNLLRKITSMAYKAEDESNAKN